MLLLLLLLLLHSWHVREVVTADNSSPLRSRQKVY